MNNLDRFTFRIWDSAKQEWLFSYNKCGGFSLIGEVMIFNEYYDVIKEYNLLNLKNDLCIMQSTTLRDTDDKLIYENDILKLQFLNKKEYTYYGIINYNKQSGSFIIIDTARKAEFGLSDISNFNPKIIGNIYENPELIQKHQLTILSNYV